MPTFFDTLLTDIDDRQALEKKQNRKKFYDLMKENGFDFDDIDEATRLPKSMIPVIQNSAEEFYRFNLVLSKLNKEKIYTVAEAVTFLITDYIDAQVALKCLDELNFYAVKTELTKKYRVHEEQKSLTSLLDFLDAD